MAAGDSLSGQQFDPSAVNRVQHVSPQWIMENMKTSNAGPGKESWQQTSDYIHKNHFDQDPEHWDEFRQSVREKGVRKPIKTTGDYVWDGHHRVITAAEEGVKTVPVRAMRK